jgi:hypothetical protein
VEVQYAGRSTRKRRLTMEYFAGLDVLLEETHSCVLNREGVV